MPANCPEFAKVGTSSIDSSALPGPIQGSVYLGQPLPGQTYRIFLTAYGFATHVKLAGSVQPDPQTGRVVALPGPAADRRSRTFTSTSSAPSAACFATPKQCGTYPVATRFTPWDCALPTRSRPPIHRSTTGPNGRPARAPPSRSTRR